MKQKKGYTIWLTGLPCSGKSTIAKLLAKKLKAKKKLVEILDGDVIRKNLWNNLGFSKKDRIINLKRTIYLSKILNRNSVITIVAFVSPYRSIRQYARRTLKQFVEVFVRCPLEVCRERDVKGLYKKALQGVIKDFTGVTHPYEPPLKMEIIVDTDVLTPETCVEKILQFLSKNGAV